MSGPAIYITEGIVHSSAETIAAAKALIIRKRARLAITANQASSAWTDDEDLEAQISTVLRHRDVFGPDYSSVIRGCVIGGGDPLARCPREVRRRYARSKRCPVR